LAYTGSKQHQFQERELTKEQICKKDNLQTQARNQRGSLGADEPPLEPRM